MFHRLTAAIMTAVFASSVFSSTVPATTYALDSEISQEILPSLEEGTYKEGQVLVTLAAPDNTPLTKEGEVSFDSDMTVEHSMDFGDADILADNSTESAFLKDKTLYVVSVASDEYSTEELLKTLDKQAYVVSVEPDYYIKKLSVTNDTYSNYQWDLGSTDTFSSSTATGINYAGYSQPSNSETPIVAVVDTGVDYTHPDLKDHMWQNNTSLGGTYGYDFGDNDSDPMDTDGHGTHCAGTIGAVSNNAAGIAGIASDVKIMALKIFDSQDNATTTNVASAFNYIYRAQELGVKIQAVNCSFGGSPSTSTIATLIEKIGKNGALVVFASGNDGTNHDNDTSNICPYDLNSTYTVVVGASTAADTRAVYSDYGSKTVDLFAPGHMILSTVCQDTFMPSIYSEEERKNLVSYYTDFGDNTTLVTGEEVGLTARNSVVSSGFVHTSEDFFDKNTGSMKLSFSGGRSSQLAVYIDVTSLNLDQTATYYVGYDMGIPEDGYISWEHNTMQRSALGNYHFMEQDGKTYLLVVGLSGNLSSISTLYFDNVGISTANPDVSSFGKYDFYNGTSMAAPVVTGAIAVLAKTYSSDTAIQRRERLMTCIRTTNTFTGLCKSNGILDLSKVPSATYKTTATDSDATSSDSSSSSSKKVAVTKVKLNKKKATIHFKKKKKLKLKATVTPTNASNKKVKWTVSNTKYASVTQKGVVKAKKKGIGHTVTIYATAKDGSKKKASCKVKIKRK